LYTRSRPPSECFTRARACDRCQISRRAA
jgi:hypothetical protein